MTFNPDNFLTHEKDIFNSLNDKYDLSYSNNIIGKWENAISIAIGIGIIPKQFNTRVIIKVLKLIIPPINIKKTTSGTAFYLKKKI